MASKQELVEIVLRIKGQQQVAEGTGVAKKGIKGVGEATRKTSKESTKAAKANSILTSSYKGLGRAAKYGLGFLAAGGVFALESAVTRTEELSKTTSGLSRNFGMATNVASRWGSVAHSRGIDSKALTTTFSVLSSKMVEASRKGGTAMTAFNQLGITHKELTAHANDATWGIMRVTKALGEEAGGTKRTAAAKNVLGKGFQTLVPLMSEGTKGLKKQLMWADKYGSVLNTKTNKSIMDMVMANRESKVAMEGLQVQAALGLAPAITAADGVFQKFVATLNSPKLTGDQKILAIERQFEDLENFLIKAITDAIPRVAEQGGELGIKLGGAVWTGFKNSGLEGKLVISAWLFKYLGGGGLISSVSGKAGRAIGLGLINVLAPTLAAELAAGSTLGQLVSARFKMMGITSGRAFTVGVGIGAAGFGWELGEIINDATKGAFTWWTREIADNFVNDLVRSLNQGLDEANVLSFLGVSAPNFSEINLHTGTEEVAHGAHKTHHRLPPGHIPPGSELPPGGRGSHHHSGPQHRTKPAGRMNYAALPPIHVHTHIDGKEVALTVARVANRAAARA